MAQTKTDRLIALSMVPELAKEVTAQIAEAGEGISSDDITVPAFSGGGVTFAGGTLTAALQAIADETPA